MGYPLKVWSLTAVITSVSFLSWAIIQEWQKPADLIWMQLPVYIMLLLLFELPAIGLHLFCFWKLVGQNMTEQKRKFILILAGYGCMIPSIMILRIFFKMIHFSMTAGNVLLLILFLVFTGVSLIFRTRLA